MYIYIYIYIHIYTYLYIFKLRHKLKLYQFIQKLDLGLQSVDVLNPNKVQLFFWRVKFPAPFIFQEELI